jgi:predicted esterase
MPGLRDFHTFPVTMDCRYALHAPEPGPTPPLLALTLHGYGSNPAAMLRLTVRLLGERHIVAALQAPNQFYMVPDDFQSEVGYGWGTRNDMDASVALHHDMVARALDCLAARFGIERRRTLLVGFSQPVSMNYRFAAAHPGAVGAIVALCGGLPGAWMESPPPAIDASVLHISRSEDQYYPPQTARRFGERLRLAARDVEFHLIPGPHRVPSSGNAIVGPWLLSRFD